MTSENLFAPALEELREAQEHVNPVSWQRRRLDQAIDLLNWDQVLETVIGDWNAEGRPHQEAHRYAGRMRALAEGFSGLRGRAGLQPWSPIALAELAFHSGTLSGTAVLSVKFILKLWNNQFPCPPFDSLHALSRWDAHNRGVFLSWADEPWWP